MADTLRFLSAAELRQALPMADAIAGMREAFIQLSGGDATMPLRSRVGVGKENVTIVMPAYLHQSGDLGVKIVSVFPTNAAQGLPIIHALVLVLDAQTGKPLAVMEGGSLTAIRTGAGSGAATDALAREDAAVVGILGSGVQARTQLEAVCTVRRIEQVYVYSPNRAHAEDFALEMAGQGRIPSRISIVEQPDDAVRPADIICTATTASEPVFSGGAVKAGAHINAVGSYLPTMQEVDAETLQKALIVVDSREGVMAEAGDLLVPMQTGALPKDAIHAELGEILSGVKAGRSTPTQISYFKSVGVAVQDAAAARVALRNAERLGLGTELALFA